MAGEGDQDEQISLDPPEGDDEQDVERQDLQAEEQETEPEGDEVDGEERQASDREQPEGRQQEGERPHRRDRRIETLTTQLAEEKRNREDLNRRLDAVLTNQHRPPQGETPEARAQRLALLTPEDRMTTEMHETRQAFHRDMAVMQFQTQDANDKSAFQAKATVDPLYKKWDSRVEAELAELRRQNMTAPRERIMYYLIGKNAVEGRGAVKFGQRREAQRRVERQTTRPTNSGSDVSAPRRERGNSLERRLENQPL